MNVEDLILVSVDDHVVEPAHLFEGRAPGEVPGQGAALDHAATTAATPGSTRARRSSTSR